LLEGFTGTYYWVGELKPANRTSDPIEKFNSDMLWPRVISIKLGAAWRTHANRETYPIYIKGAHNRGEPDSRWLGVDAVHDLKYLIRTPHAASGLAPHHPDPLKYDENGKLDARSGLKSGWILLDREAYVDQTRLTKPHSRPPKPRPRGDPPGRDWPLFDPSAILSKEQGWREDRHREKFKKRAGILSDDETPPLGMHIWWLTTTTHQHLLQPVPINIYQVNPKNYEGEQAQARDLELPKPNRTMMERAGAVAQDRARDAYMAMTMDWAPSVSEVAAARRAEKLAAEEQRKLRESGIWRFQNCIRTSLGGCEPDAAPPTARQRLADRRVQGTPLKSETKYEKERKKAIDARNTLHETFPTDNMRFTVAEQRLAMALAAEEIGLDEEMIQQIVATGPRAPRTAVHKEVAAREGWHRVDPVDVANKTIAESRERFERDFEPGPEPEPEPEPKPGPWSAGGQKRAQTFRARQSASMAAPPIGLGSQSPNPQRGDQRSTTTSPREPYCLWCGGSDHIASDCPDTDDLVES
jgi:hypothetical protein